MRIVKDYLSLVKFSHTIFAMPFALVGFFTAVRYGNAVFSWNILFAVVLCMVFARTSAMAFNRYLDRKIDQKNPRTAIREIPAGIIKANSALWFVVFNSGCFIITAWFVNRLVFYLSPVALAVILGYSFTKRFTFLCHFILGLGLSLAPIGAYLAVTGSFAWLPVLYSVSVLLWVSGFDIIYALQDEGFDKTENLYSVPVSIGRKNALILSSILHILSVGILSYAGYYVHQGLWYWMGLVIYSALLLYQHLIISPKDISRVNMAFATMNGVASVLFAIFAIADMFL
jgi:4-hydroxybenzoate polyprenyltransferase